MLLAWSTAGPSHPGKGTPSQIKEPHTFNLSPHEGRKETLSTAKEASLPPVQPKGSAWLLLLHEWKEVLALQVEDAAGIYIAEFECHHPPGLPSDLCSAEEGIRS